MWFLSSILFNDYAFFRITSTMLVWIEQFFPAMLVVFLSQIERRSIIIYIAYSLWSILNKLFSWLLIFSPFIIIFELFSESIVSLIGISICIKLYSKVLLSAHFLLLLFLNLYLYVSLYINWYIWLRICNGIIILEVLILW